MDSTILSEKKYKIKDLLSLCEFPIDQKWNLIYRASRDGFETAKFHSNCDNITNTLIVIKSSHGNIFGGYTEQTWNFNDSYSEQTRKNTGDYKADPNSFIFSLINKLNEPIKIKWPKNNGISCQTAYGPIFGGGYDFHITEKSNINTSSNSNLGHSYTHPDYRFETNEAKTFLAGSYNFQVSEIEVYTKQ
jgi:BTB/POZ domain-containing protein KCTD9